MAKSILREANILDAVYKEEESTEDDSTINSYVWLQLQDLQTEKIFSICLTQDIIKEIILSTKVIQCPHCKTDLTQDQVNEIASKSQTIHDLGSKEFIDFSIELKNRDKPIFIMCDPNSDEITADMIKNEEGI